MAEESVTRLKLPQKAKKHKILSNGALLLLYENGEEENMVQRHFKQALTRIGRPDVLSVLPRGIPRNVQFESFGKSDDCEKMLLDSGILR